MNFPKSLEYLSGFAWNKELTKIKIPKNVKTLGEDAFRGCNLSGKLYIPDSVEDIGLSAFLGNNLEEVSLNPDMYSSKNKVLGKIFDKGVKIKVR